MLPHIPQLFEFIHVKSVKDLPHLVVVVLLVFGIGLGVYLASQKQIFNKRANEDFTVELKFIPEQIQIEAGKDYEAKIAINPKGQRVSAVQLNITYDPEVFSLLEVKSGGFLPVALRVRDDHEGNLNLVYGSTIESQANKPGILSVIKFKILNADSGSIQIKPTSEVSISSKEGNALNVFPKLVVKPLELDKSGEVRYPDNLLLEKAFFASSDPVVRDFKESLEPKPEHKPGRVKPEFSEAFIKQLGTDIFISPIAALNQVLEEKMGEILGK